MQEVNKSQTYRIEIRFDFHGTRTEAEAKAVEISASLGPSAKVTSIYDEWDEVTSDWPSDVPR